MTVKSVALIAGSDRRVKILLEEEPTLSTDESKYNLHFQIGTYFEYDDQEWQVDAIDVAAHKVIIHNRFRSGKTITWSLEEANNKQYQI